MGTSSSVGELNGKLNRLAKEMSDPKRPLNVVGVQAKALFIASAASAGVLGTKPQGKRKKIGARYDFGGKKGHGIGTNSIVVFYFGPAHLMNNDTVSHMILPRRRAGVRTRRRQAARALRFPSGEFASSADHPGTTGKHFAEKAKAAVRRTAPRTYKREGLTEPLRRAF